MESAHHDETSNDSCTASILEELQIDPNKIRGDAIGDTLYSERYVIKLLMRLTEHKDEQWNEDVESDMCTLWDMAAQPDVVKFLMQHDSLSLFINVIQTTTVPRLLEIMVGLLGNMCCVKEVREELANQEEMQDTLLELLTCPDSPTLIQLVRLFQSIAWDLIKPDRRSISLTDQHWFEKQMVNSQFPLYLSFILSSSTCEELLMAVIELLYLCSLNISDKDFSQYFATPELVDGMVESWTQLFSACKEENKFEFLNKSLEKTAQHWIIALLAFAGHEKGRSSLGRSAKDINSILTDLIEEPKNVSEEAILMSAVSLLEAIVGYHFCPIVFCKTLAIVPRVIENGAAGSSEEQEEECDGLDESQVSELTLKESLGNYFVEVVKKVDHLTLESTLTTCEEKSVKIFWNVITERLPVNTA